MFDPISDLEKRYNNASMDAKLLLADLITEAALRSNLPEHKKFEVRIMSAHKNLDVLLCEVSRKFSVPIPNTDEGHELMKKIYPARQAYFEYLQLMKVGLENFLKEVPAPEIPQEYVRRAENPFDSLR